MPCIASFHAIQTKDDNDDDNDDDDGDDDDEDDCDEGAVTQWVTALYQAGSETHHSVHCAVCNVQS